MAAVHQHFRLDPRILDFYTGRAQAYEGKGNVERARADYKKALSLPVTYAMSKKYRDMAREGLDLLERRMKSGN